MVVVDSQVHIWEAGGPPPNHRQEAFSADDLIREMTKARVDRAILVPPLWDPNRNEYSIQSAARHPDRFGVMGLVDLSRPMDSGQFAAWLKKNNLLGVRLSFNNPQRRATLAAGHADWLWASAEGARAPVMVLAPFLSALIGAIARQHPDLKIIVDHMAIPRGWKAPAAFEHLPELMALAKYDNVAVKMGSVPNYADGDVYPYRSLHEYLKRVIDAFGPMRCFWASDYSRLIGPYTECASMFRDELSWLSAEERSAIMGVGLCNWLNWDTQE